MSRFNASCGPHIYSRIVQRLIEVVNTPRESSRQAHHKGATEGFGAEEDHSLSRGHAGDFQLDEIEETALPG